MKIETKLFQAVVASVLLIGGCRTAEIDLVGTWRSYNPTVPPPEPVVYQVGRIAFSPDGTVVHWRDILTSPWTEEPETNKYTVKDRTLILNPDDSKMRVEYRLTREKDDILLQGQYDLMPMRLRREETQQSPAGDRLKAPPEE